MTKCILSEERDLLDVPSMLGTCVYIERDTEREGIYIYIYIYIYIMCTSGVFVLLE